MKIRSSFVSNSSSSSFLIVFQNIFDFYDFKTFKSFDFFEQDLRNATEESGLNLLKDAIFECYLDEYERFSSGESYTDKLVTYEISNLFKLAKLSDKEFTESIEKVKTLKEKYTDMIRKKYPKMMGNIFISKAPRALLTSEESDFYESVLEEFNKEFNSDEFYNELEKDSDKIANDLKDALKKEGYEVKAICKNEAFESDEERERNTKEYNFITFIKTNPERNYQIIIVNE